MRAFHLGHRYAINVEWRGGCHPFWRSSLNMPGEMLMGVGPFVVCLIDKAARRRFWSSLRDASGRS